MICIREMKPYNAYEMNGNRRPSSTSMMNPTRSGSFCSLPPNNNFASNRPKKSGKRHSIDYTTSSRANFPIGLPHISVADDASCGDDDSVQDESGFNSKFDRKDIFLSRSPGRTHGPFSETSEMSEKNSDGSGVNPDRFNRMSGHVAQAIGTSVHVLCRMRPLSTSSSFISSSSSSSSSNCTPKNANVVGIRNSLRQFVFNENDDDESEDQDDDEETSQKKGEESTNYTITGNFLEYFDEFKNSKGVFEYSKIFNERASQKKVFTSPEIKNILDSLFLGFNGTIFTYGQTNAGKTYTMEGQSMKSVKNRGVMPRSIGYIFSTINETMKKQALEKEKNNLLLHSNKDLNDENLSERNDDNNKDINDDNNDKNGIKKNSFTDFTVSVSYYEIYCEKVRDILNPNSDNMKLRETKNDGFVVQDLTEIICQTELEVLQILEKGKINRATAATLMNAVSSRSHSIFCITIKQRITVTNTIPSSVPTTPSTTSKNENKFENRFENNCIDINDDTNQINGNGDSNGNGNSNGNVCTSILMRKSRLFLVDLAGSEKVSQTGAEGKKFRVNKKHKYL